MLLKGEGFGFGFDAGSRSRVTLEVELSGLTGSFFELSCDVSMMIENQR